MTLEELESALRCGATGGGFERTLRAHGAGLLALGRGADVVPCLDALPAFLPARDEILGDLLRLYRRSGEGSALCVVCYALLPSVGRLVRRLAPKAPWRRGELLDDLVYVTVMQAARFDPDRRSSHVQAGLERDIRHELWRTWLREYAVRKRLRALARAAPSLGAGAPSDGCTLDDLPGPAGAPRPRALPFDDDDRAEMDRLLRSLFDAGVVDEREFRLLRESRVFERRVASVAGELGMTEAAARKAIQRAGPRVRAALHARLLEQGGPPQGPPGGAGGRRVRAATRREPTAHA